MAPNDPIPVNAVLHDENFANNDLVTGPRPSLANSDNRRSGNVNVSDSDTGSGIGNPESEKRYANNARGQKTGSEGDPKVSPRALRIDETALREPACQRLQATTGEACSDPK